eukprot:scaffold6402_cov110-Isochrysis_galbana.AAC.3
MCAWGVWVVTTCRGAGGGRVESMCGGGAQVEVRTNAAAPTVWAGSTNRPLKLPIPGHAQRGLASSHQTAPHRARGVQQSGV